MRAGGFRTGGGFAVPSCRGSPSSAASAHLPPAANPLTPRFLEELLLRRPSPRSPPTPAGLSVYDPCASFDQTFQRPPPARHELVTPAAGTSPPPTSRDLLRSPRDPLRSPRSQSPRSCADDPFALLGREIRMATPPMTAGGGSSPTSGKGPSPRQPAAPMVAPVSFATPSRRYAPGQTAAAELVTQDGSLNPARVPFPSLRHARHLATVTPQPVDRRKPPANRDESALRRMSIESLHPRLHDERLSRLYSTKAAYSARAGESVTISTWSRCL